jgi:hypothetical protein
MRPGTGLEKLGTGIGLDSGRHQNQGPAKDQGSSNQKRWGKARHEIPPDLTNTRQKARDNDRVKSIGLETEKPLREQRRLLERWAWSGFLELAKGVEPPTCSLRVPFFGLNTNLSKKRI